MIHYFNEPTIEAGAIPLGFPLFTLCGESLVFDLPTEKWNMSYSPDKSKVNCLNCKQILGKNFKGNGILVPVLDGEDDDLVASDKQFLSWIYDRLVFQYKENEMYDYMHRLKKIVDATGTKDAEVKRMKKVFTKLAQLMKHYEVPSEMGIIIIKEAGK